MKKANLNILLVEDESLLALEFSTCIKNCGFNVVDYVTNSKEAIKIVTENEINLIIMDININEDIDGIDLYKLLNTDAFVIYLTAYKDDKTIAKAIETDPLGYLTKPLNNSELKALLQLADMKVAKELDSKTKNFKLSQNYCFDVTDDTLYYKKRFVKISTKKIELLKLLIEANGQAISFKTIENEIWKDSSPSESALRTLIYRLRGELKEDVIENELNFGIKLKKDSSPDTCGT